MENETQVGSAINEQDGELEIVLDDTVSKEQYNQVFARAKKAEAEKKALAEKLASLEKKPTEKVELKETKEEKPSYGSVSFEEALELRLQGYDKDAVEFIMKNGGLKSLDNPYVKVAVQSIKEQKKAENAISTDDTSKSDIEKKYTNEQLKNMSTEELLKILPKRK
jgi:hypothetical protein